MNVEDELRAEIALLKTQVAELQQRTIGEIRLGPRGETPEEIAARAERMTTLIERIKKENDPARLKHEHETDPQGRQICTTSGEAPSKVRAEQTAQTGQHVSYIVLCEEERAKGFVRPYRDAYIHDKCGTVTSMGRALSETYARDPSFYGATYCCGCMAHFPVGEFKWSRDGMLVGS